jgi:regulator of sigma E protease
MLTTIIAGVFVLGVVILVHEFGHFIVAKWSGVFVKTFSIGFGKKILRKRKGETEYTLSILPLGGYVKFAGETEYYDEGEIPEAPPEEERKPPDEIPDSEIPRERYFTTKPRSIRAAVLFAGPFMNYLLAVFLYIGVLFIQGSSVYPTTVVGDVVADSPADSAGLEVGDEIVSIDGIETRDWGDVIDAVVEDVKGTRIFRVDRAGVLLEIPYRAMVDDESIRLGFDAFVPPKVGRVQRDKPAYVAGIREGSVIESINDTTITTFDDLRRIVNASPETPLYFEWSHNNEAHADTIVPLALKALKPGTVNEFSVIGVIGLSPDYIKKRESFAASVVGGFNSANGMIVRIVSYLGMLFTGRIGVDTLGGPILITQMAGDVARWGFDYLLVFLAFFSINLCIFNLLPLLPFDGGHLVLLLYEVVAKRRVNRRLRDIFAQAGFVLIILLMVFVILLDINRCSGSAPGFF